MWSARSTCWKSWRASTATTTFPTRCPHSPARSSRCPTSRRTRKLRETMLALGYDEAISITFISEQEAQDVRQRRAAGAGQPAERRGGIHAQLACCPACSNMVGYNLNRGTSDVRLFEAGEVFEKLGDRHDEHRRWPSLPPATLRPRAFTAQQSPYTFFHLKGDVEAVAGGVSAPAALLRRQDASVLPSRALGARRARWRDRGALRPASSRGRGRTQAAPGRLPRRSVARPSL